MGKPHDSFAYASLELLDVIAARGSLGNYRKDHGVLIFDPVVDFSHQQTQSSFILLDLGEVSGDFGSADNFSALVGDRGNGNRNLHRLAVAVSPNGSESLDFFAELEPANDFDFLVMAIIGNYDVDRLTYRLVRLKTKKPLCGFVPAGDGTGKVGADDGIEG